MSALACQTPIASAPVLQVARGVSVGNMAEVSSDIFQGRPIDLHRFRAVFPDRWSAFIRAHFQSTAHVAYFFGVDDKCARNWWNGTSGPSGAFVAAVCAQYPQAAAILWREAA